jgi:hypothetical protein
MKRNETIKKIKGQKTKQNETKKFEKRNETRKITGFEKKRNETEKNQK